MSINLLPRSLFTCPVCGLPKVHYRLLGYQCSNPEHRGEMMSGYAPPRSGQLFGEEIEMGFIDEQTPAAPPPLRAEEPMLSTTIVNHGAEPISYEALKELLSAEIQRRLKELTKPYFEELDSLIMYGDPTGEIESGRLFDRHFPDPDSEQDARIAHGGEVFRDMLKQTADSHDALIAALKKLRTEKGQSDNGTDTDSTDKPDISAGG